MVEHSEYQKNVERSIDEKLSTIRNKKYDGNIILVFGSFPLWNEKICRYIDDLSKIMVSHKIIVVSEGLNLDEDELNKKYFCEYIQIPHILEHGCPKTGENVFLEKNEKEIIVHTQYLKNASTTVKLIQDDFTTDRANQLVLWLHNFYQELLNIIKPERIVMWNEYFSNHFILNRICQEKNIPAFIMEYGPITGTYSIDFIGSFGKSFPSVCSKDFQKIVISDNDISSTKSFIEEQKKGGYNQYEQPKVDLKYLNSIKDKKPIVVYMGTAHFDSGFVTGDESVPFNCPLFSTDSEAVIFLRNICEIRGWTLVHKPHPIMRQNYNLNGVLYIEECNVNELFDIADVVVTVSSKISYLTMIRNKATVMLGYNQINFKNIVYEAFEKEQIEWKLYEAITKGVTDEMKSNFIKHVAQMKHYLFDNNTEKQWKFGLPIENAAQVLENPLCDSDYMVYDNDFKYKISRYKKSILKRLGKNKSSVLIDKFIYVMKEAGLISKYKTK